MTGNAPPQRSHLPSVVQQPRWSMGGRPLRNRILTRQYAIIEDATGRRREAGAWRQLHHAVACLWRSCSPLPLCDNDLLPGIIRTPACRPSTTFEQPQDGPKLPVPIKFALVSKPVAFQDASQFSRQIGDSDPVENYLFLVLGLEFCT